jgi:carbamate kinase
MLIVAALGGNALLKRGESPTAEAQRKNLGDAACALAELAAEHTLVVVHGNGPQVGLLALQADAYKAIEPYPLDVLGAESEGMIGYMIEQELGNRLSGRNIATLLTQIEVDADDPAFDDPSKPIGPVYDRETADRLAAERGWSIARDGEHWRRVVASPEPRRILELNTIRLLVEADVIVICSGGGGIPVVATAGGAIHGVEAVIDKDLAAALLARQLDADALLMLTDVDAVYENWGTPEQTPIPRATPAELRKRDFARGSMAPKVEAACRFVEAGGRLAGIGRLADAPTIARGETGTVVDT